MSNTYNANEYQFFFSQVVNFVSGSDLVLPAYNDRIVAVNNDYYVPTVHTAFKSYVPKGSTHYYPQGENRVLSYELKCQYADGLVNKTHAEYGIYLGLKNTKTITIASPNGFINASSSLLNVPSIVEKNLPFFDEDTAQQCFLWALTSEQTFDTSGIRASLDGLPIYFNHIVTVKTAFPTEVQI